MLSMIRTSVTDKRHLSAFVSWAHSAHDWSEARSESWEKTVVEFTGSLRSHGVAADVDLFHVDDADVDWTRFGPQRIADSDVTIIAVSSAWRERWEGNNSPNVGAGVAQEADELHGLFQCDQGLFRSTVKIVILPGASEDDIPNDLRRLPRYHVLAFNAAGLEKLLRALFRKPRYVLPPLGVRPDLPPLNVISDSSSGTGTFATASEGLVQPSNPAVQEAKLRAELAQAEDTLRALPAPGPGEGPNLPWYRAWEKAQQHQASILGSLAALAVATDTLKSVSESLLLVSAMLAEVASQEVADARSLLANGMYREAHALLTEAVDRLRAGRPPEGGASAVGQDTHEIVRSLRRIAHTQHKEKLAELDEVVGRAAASVVYAGNQILGELIDEVPALVRPLSSQIEIRTLISRKQLEAIYGDLSKQAAEQLAMIFQQRFEERIAPNVSAVLQTISVLPRQFQEVLDKHFLDTAPAADQGTLAPWGTIMPTLQLEARLSAEGVRLVDLRKTEHELLIYEFKEEIKRITGKSAFNSVFVVLLSAALKLLWAMFRDDPLSTISKERRVKVVKRRLVTALQHALNGDDVRSAVGVASRDIASELHQQSEPVRHYLEEATSTIDSADFADWFLQHQSTVHQVLDRAAVQLDQIAARF